MPKLTDMTKKSALPTRRFGVEGMPLCARNTAILIAAITCITFSTLSEAANGVTQASRAWPNKRIPYTVCMVKGSEESELQFDSRLQRDGCTRTDVLEIGVFIILYDAIKKWNDTYGTQVAFFPAPKADPTATTVIFRKAKKLNSCSTGIVGYQTTRKKHFVNVGTLCEAKMGTVWHELLHVAGFYHEMQRSDRKTVYKTITWANTKSNLEKSAQTAWSDQCVKESNCTPMMGAYDFGSIMQYSIKNNGRPTVTFTPLGAQLAVKAKVGQRDDLSPTDFQALKTLYP